MYIFFTAGAASVSVPVLSKTTVAASAAASSALPLFTVIPICPHSFMAERTATGIDSLSAQEKSTISTERAFDAFFVSSHTSAVPIKL